MNVIVSVDVYLDVDPDDHSTPSERALSALHAAGLEGDVLDVQTSEPPEYYVRSRPSST